MNVLLSSIIIESEFDVDDISRMSSYVSSLFFRVLGDAGVIEKKYFHVSV